MVASGSPPIFPGILLLAGPYIKLGMSYNLGLDAVPGRSGMKKSFTDAFSLSSMNRSS
jgi:hypothetical protein